MTDNRLACIILAAGQGKRIKSARPKPLHKVAGRPMLNMLVSSVETLGPDKIIVVTAPDTRELVAASIAPHQTAVQEIPRGTGDAATCR